MHIYGVKWTVLLRALLAVATCVKISQAQPCPVTGCSGCATSSISCDYAGLTTFPQLPVEMQRIAESLSLIGNALEGLDENALENYTQLRTLNFAANHLTELQEGVFAANTHLEFLVLADNQLSELPVGLFNGNAELEFLSLADNQLTTLPELLFSTTTQLSRLGIQDNPFLCDCKLRWLPPFLANVVQLQEPTCAIPDELRGLEIRSLSQDQLVCELPNSPTIQNATCVEEGIFIEWTNVWSNHHLTEHYNGTLTTMNSTSPPREIHFQTNTTEYTVKDTDAGIDYWIEICAHNTYGENCSTPYLYNSSLCKAGQDDDDLDRGIIALIVTLSLLLPLLCCLLLICGLFCCYISCIKKKSQVDEVEKGIPKFTRV